MKGLIRFIVLFFITGCDSDDASAVRELDLNSGNVIQYQHDVDRDYYLGQRFRTSYIFVDNQTVLSVDSLITDNQYYRFVYDPSLELQLDIEAALHIFPAGTPQDVLTRWVETMGNGQSQPTLDHQSFAIDIEISADQFLHFFTDTQGSNFAKHQVAFSIPAQNRSGQFALSAISEEMQIDYPSGKDYPVQALPSPRTLADSQRIEAAAPLHIEDKYYSIPARTSHPQARWSGGGCMVGSSTQRWIYPDQGAILYVRYFASTDFNNSAWIWFFEPTVSIEDLNRYASLTSFEDSELESLTPIGKAKLGADLVHHVSESSIGTHNDAQGSGVEYDIYTVAYHLDSMVKDGVYQLEGFDATFDMRVYNQDTIEGCPLTGDGGTGGGGTGI
ncbi:hypothetical protein [Vibrio sp. WXL103]|uniref:hypothetical protein n=1 Tax=Vibrio sp. WXL103 TaxID=3450710 RepID=UPI003EC71940